MFVILVDALLRRDTIKRSGVRLIFDICRGGEIGRRTGLKIPRW